MPAITSQINDKWIKSSILGTTWASSEIILGSFLHNLRIPFSGNILTAIGLIILIAASYKWSDKGLFWRAGLICALLKTMSPSAVIFGPMIAIFAEALLLEFSVRILGRNMTGFIVGSALAMSWNLFQKIINFIIFYGSNIIEVYTNLMKFAEKQLRLHFDAVWMPVLVLLVLYAFFGIISAIIGIRTGKAIVSGKTPAVKKFTFSHIEQTGKGKQNHFSYSLVWLSVNLILLIGLLLLIGKINFSIWSALIILTTIIWAYRYKRAYRQIIRPRFWIFFALITMLTALVFTRLEPEPVSVTEAIFIGLEMNLRAVVVIMGFTVIGSELYNPKIRAFFGTGYFKQLPLAIEISVETLPSVIANTPDVKTILKNPVLVVSHLINYAEFRLNELKTNTQADHKVFIITGNIGSGKTTLLKRIAHRFHDENVEISGFITLRQMQEGKTTGYSIFNIGTGKESEFLHINGNSNQERIGKYYISQNAFAEADTILETHQNCVFIIDEIGKLELGGKGWSSLLQRVLHQNKYRLILSVREEILPQLMDKFSISAERIFNIQQEDPDEIIAAILLSFKEA